MCVYVLDEWEGECERRGRDKQSDSKKKKWGECHGLNLLFLAAEWCEKKSLPTDKPHLTEAFVQTFCLHILTVWVQARESKWVGEKKRKGAGVTWLHRPQQSLQNKVLSLDTAQQSKTLNSIHKVSNIRRAKLATNATATHPTARFYWCKPTAE